MTDESSQPKARDPRDVSTIAFPYVSLEDAIDTARAILNKGAAALSREQLAAAMGQQPGSGNFSTKVGGARMFGLIETVAGKYQITRLGFDILDSNDARSKAGMLRAFLNVPLYKRVYDEFRGHQLPPRPHGLESAFVSFGVAAKQKDRARRAFDNSAQLAGFFEHGNDRLVEPVLAPIVGREPARPSPESAAEPPAPPPPPRAVVEPPQMPAAAEHPFIMGLLISLPSLGDNWDAEARVKWLQAAATAFELMYKGGAPITIAPSAGIIAFRGRKRETQGDQNG